MKCIRFKNYNLYALGNIELLKDKLCVSVAGSRKIDVPSTIWLKEQVSKCSHPVISGLALGADTVAHKTALKNDIPTIAILPCGLGNITPKSNRGLAKKIVDHGGLLLSEYPPDRSAFNYTYFERNKLIAELGSILLVPQFDSKSGTRHTVDHARDKGKTIFVQNTKRYSGNKEILADSSYSTIAL